MRSTLLLVCLMTALGCLEDRTDPVDAGADLQPDVELDTSAPDTGDDPVPTDTGEPEPEDPLLALGAACLLDIECTSGRCAGTCDDGRICVPSSCSTDADCGTGGAATACCLAGQCAVVPGDACGDRAGGPGASCYGGGDSDCAAGSKCMSACLPAAFCAAPCTGAADCTDAEWDCFPVGGGATYCLPDPDLQGQCTLDLDCPAGQICDLFLSFDGDKVVTKCNPAQGATMGAKCAVDDTCALGICWKGPGQSGTCGATCTEDADCACDGGACSKDLLCMPIVFGLGAGVGSAPLCWEGTRCADNDECIVAMDTLAAECAPTWRHVSIEEVCTVPGNGAGLGPGAMCQFNDDCAAKLCLQNVCYTPIPAGSKCGSCKVGESWCNASCVSGTCMDGRCTSVCSDDTACNKQATGTVCVSHEFQVSGGVDHAPVCISGPRCASDSECKPGSLCCGIDGGDEWATVCRKPPSVKGGLPKEAACTSHFQCESKRCADATCQPRQPQGSACTASADCISSLCAPGGCASPCATDDDCDGAKCVLSVVPTVLNPQATTNVCVP